MTNEQKAQREGGLVEKWRESGFVHMMMCADELQAALRALKAATVGKLLKEADDCDVAHAFTTANALRYAAKQIDAELKKLGV